MSEAENRRVVELLWELFEARQWDEAGRLLHEDLVAEWPHSGERILGRENFLAVNRSYPGRWTIQVRRVVAEGGRVVSEVMVEHDEQGSVFAASFFELRDARIARITEYWVDAYAEDPPEWRARWTERYDVRSRS